MCTQNRIHTGTSTHTVGYQQRFLCQLASRVAYTHNGVLFHSIHSELGWQYLWMWIWKGKACCTIKCRYAAHQTIYEREMSQNTQWWLTISCYCCYYCCCCCCCCWLSLRFWGESSTPSLSVSVFLCHPSTVGLTCFSSFLVSVLCLSPSVYQAPSLLFQFLSPQILSAINKLEAIGASFLYKFDLNNDAYEWMNEWINEWFELSRLREG